MPMMQDILEEVFQEWARADSINAPMHSLHEAHSVIEEEFDEFWDEVKKNPRKHPLRTTLARAELIQLAAMAVRAIYDVCDKGK
jgi:cephalosporin-C deacetylase-like acetyl esterase